MFILRNIFIYFMLFFFTICVNARIAKEICITKIAEILAEPVVKEADTIAVFDWDQTISANEGKEDIRETDPETGTLAVINQLHQDGVKTMVLTARMGGRAIGGRFSQEDFDAMLKNMKDALTGVKWIENGAIAEPKFQEYAVEYNRVLAEDDIIFAGGETTWPGSKGAALAYLIDNDKLASKPKNIIFIDNDRRKIQDIKNTFEHRDENVYLYLYPNSAKYDPERRYNIADAPCP